MADEEIPVRSEAVRELLDDASPALGTEVDEDVAAEHQIERAFSGRAVVVKIHPPEADQLAQLGPGFHEGGVRAGALQHERFEMALGNLVDLVDGPHRRLGPPQRMGRQVRGQDVDLPALESRQQRHRQRVGLFAR